MSDEALALIEDLIASAGFTPEEAMRYAAYLGYIEPDLYGSELYDGSTGGGETSIGSGMQSIGGGDVTYAVDPPSTGQREPFSLRGDIAAFSPETSGQMSDPYPFRQAGQSSAFVTDILNRLAGPDARSMGNPQPVPINYSGTYLDLLSRSRLLASGSMNPYTGAPQGPDAWADGQWMPRGFAAANSAFPRAGTGSSGSAAIGQPASLGKAPMQHARPVQPVPAPQPAVQRQALARPVAVPAAQRQVFARPVVAPAAQRQTVNRPAAPSIRSSGVGRR